MPIKKYKKISPLPFDQKKCENNVNLYKHKTSTSKFAAITYYIIMSISFCSFTSSSARLHWPHQQPTFTIMLNPAGDAQHAGRQIGDSFERGITLQCAEQLKQQLETQYPGVAVTLTRSPGEIIPELQNANFANRLVVDLFISLHFYIETETKPNLFIYYFSYNNHLVPKPTDFAFYYYDQAYLFKQKTTQAWAKSLFNLLKQDVYSKLFTVHDTLCFPFKPLIGITAPALAVEASIKESSDWQTYVEPLVIALGSIIKTKK